LALVLACAACTDTVVLEDDPFVDLVALEVTPADTTLSITDLAAEAQTVEFVATGTFRDGTQRDVTSLVMWTVDNRAPGDFDRPGHWVTSRRAAGRAVARAIAGDHGEATAALTVIVTTTITDPAAPPGAPAEPSTEHDFARSPRLHYPATLTRFPQGLDSIELQLDGGQDNDSFRLAFDSDVLHLTVLTGAERWQPDAATWYLISASHPGGDVSLAISAANSQTPANSFSAMPATLSFSSAHAPGAITYWAGGSNNILSATLAVPAPAPMYPAPGDGKCVGCHVVSRDGKQLAFGYDGEQLRTVDVEGLAPIVDNKAPMGWATFSPDGGRLLIADKGNLTLLDAKTGAPIGPNGGRVPLPRGLKATHPDWSPDGKYVAVTLAQAILANIEVNGGEIARIPYADGVWGAPEVLVPRVGPMENNFFPRYSPDGSHLAYVRATGNSRQATSAELRLMRAGGGPPIALRLANRKLGGSTFEQSDLANTMPWWAPSNDGLAWLAFSSERPYGTRRGRGPSQIWIAAIDFARTDDDPSFPAFWLPAQDLDAKHSNPIWIPALQVE
jgi:dipeptidyl aminopeptidase/acylaminoacyl peptidase